MEDAGRKNERGNERKCMGQGGKGKQRGSGEGRADRREEGGGRSGRGRAP